MREDQRPKLPKAHDNEVCLLLIQLPFALGHKSNAHVGSLNHRRVVVPVADGDDLRFQPELADARNLGFLVWSQTGEHYKLGFREDQEQLPLIFNILQRNAQRGTIDANQVRSFKEILFNLVKYMLCL